MSIRVDARELQEVLRLTPPDQNIMLVGRHGIGKSEIITQFFAARGMRVVAFFLGQMSDPGDLIGLMHKDEATGRSVFLPPYWWPREDEPVALFLDELNRARPEILQSIHDLALNQTLAGKRLPVGSVIISAVNQGDEYQLTDLDPALVSRFNLYEFAPTAEDWLLWANARGLDERVIAFLQKHPEYLDGEALAPDEGLRLAGLVKRADRRAWARTAAFIGGHPRLEEIHIKIVAGMVGTAAASAFRQSLAQAARVSARDVLLDFARHRAQIDTLALADLVLLNEQIFYYLQSHGCPDERAPANLLAYLRRLQELKQAEAVAHLAALMENPKFARAAEVLAGSLEIISLLTDYITGIQV